MMLKKISLVLWKRDSVSIKGTNFFRWLHFALSKNYLSIFTATFLVFIVN